jgi:hypothetical protein
MMLPPGVLSVKLSLVPKFYGFGYQNQCPWRPLQSDDKKKNGYLVKQGH